MNRKFTEEKISWPIKILKLSVFRAPKSLA